METPAGVAPGSASSPIPIHSGSTSVLPRLALSTLNRLSLNFRPLTFEKQPANHANHAKDSAQITFSESFCFNVIRMFRGQFIVRVHSWYVLLPYGLRSNRWNTLRNRRNTLRFRTSGRHEFARLHRPVNPLVDSCLQHLLNTVLAFGTEFAAYLGTTRIFFRRSS
jgi:hypothetical protein